MFGVSYILPSIEGHKETSLSEGGSESGNSEAIQEPPQDPKAWSKAANEAAQEKTERKEVIRWTMVQYPPASRTVS